MKVLIADKFEKTGIEGLKGLGCEVVNEPDVTAEALAERAAGAEVVVVRSKKVPAKSIEGLRGVKLIIRAGAGYDNIDVAAADRAGIAVANCPGMNAIAVAELAMAHLLALDRRLVDQTATAREGRWDKKEFGKTGAGGARGLKGATLGVVGMGAIGKAVIARAKAFEMRVIAWSRSLTEAKASEMGVTFGGNDRAALIAMAGQCDAVSIHLPGAAETKQIIGREFFEAMRPGAIFINTARGSVVDEGALRDAIRTKGIRAGLDVHENQPAEPQAAWTSETATLPGVTVTHHSGASTDQAQNAVAEEVVRIVKVFGESGRVENRVSGGKR